MNATERVLIVDDDASGRLPMRAALRKVGYEVALAEDGEQALAEYARQRFDLVLLDVDMPGLSGYEVRRRLREEAGELLPIVMVTGVDDLQSVSTAYNSGATDFISKPINWALIGHRVRYQLRAYEAKRRPRAADARNAAMLSALPDTLLRLDRAGTVLEARAAGGPGNEPALPAVGRPLAASYPAEATGRLVGAVGSALASGDDQVCEFTLDGPRRQARVFETRIARIDDEQVLVLMRDVTERKEAEARIARLAYYDSLTGLPNRVNFLERLAREAQRADRDQRGMAVLFIDLDGFKQVNDTMGHVSGDLVLAWAADRLREALRPSDLVARGVLGDPDANIARLGGDEFTVLIPNLGAAEQALMVARRVGEVMRRPFVVDGREVLLTSSIGIALFPDDGRDAVTLLQHADTAMHHAKSQGRDNSQLYSASLTERAMRRLEMDSSLRLALQRDEFRLVYQPQVDLATGRADAVEALVRWQHPIRGLVPPLDFIPVAEENGLISAIGEWVLRTACADAARWRQNGLDLRVAVNLSPVQFRNPGLLASVATILQDSGLEPAALELEVTEGALMESSDGTVATLRALRASGVSIALDDFGTGYSSLAYLTRLPIQRLKIDRSFVARLLTEAHSAAIVRAILAMAESLGMTVTAEGVESDAQARALAAMACVHQQGYHFSRPAEFDAIARIVARDWPRWAAKGADS